MYYLQSRYYDATIGRFINADDAEVVLVNYNSIINIFSYCCNSPTVSNDICGRIAAQLIARIIIGIIIGFFVQLLSDLIAYWFTVLFNTKGSFSANPGDYVSSMITWALTCVSFNKEVLEIIGMLSPLAIKHVTRVFSNSFDWIDFGLDIISTAISFLIKKALGAKAASNLKKIKKKLGTGNKTSKLINIKEKRLNMKVNIWGIKLNLSMNIAGFLVSTIYSYIKNLK